tara:strand:- start:166 stop:741 length:576 start_codon:yes stop_codon:yes gene_type:complete
LNTIFNENIILKGSEQLIPARKMSSQTASQGNANNRARNGNARPPREQKFAPNTHLYYQGRLASFYLNWHGKTQLIVIPHQKVYKLTEFYPLDLGYLFQEVYSVMEQKRVQNFTLHVFKRDWEVAPHLFIKVGMAQDIYSQFVSVPHISAGYVPPTNNNAAVANNSSTAENNENDQNVANDATGTSDNITS